MLRKYKTPYFVRCILLLGIFMVTFWSEGFTMDKHDESKEVIKFNSVSLNTTGNIILFSYQYNNNNPRIGMYDQAKDKVFSLNVPFEYQWLDVVFSPDENSLIALVNCPQENGCGQNNPGRHIAVLDLRESEPNFKIITQGERYRSSPSISPDGSTVVYVSGDFFKDDKGEVGVIKKGISSISVNGGQEKVIFPSTNLNYSFLHYDRPRLVSVGDILFSSIGYVKSEKYKSRLQRDIDFLGKRSSDSVGLKYNYKNRDVEIIEETKNYNTIGLSASSDKNFVFIDRSRSKPVNSDGKFNYEIFFSDGEKVQQISNLKSVLYKPFISSDGRKVAFLSDPERSGSWEIWLLDIESGAVRSTNIRSKIMKKIAEQYEFSPDSKRF